MVPAAPVLVPVPAPPSAALVSAPSPHASRAPLSRQLLPRVVDHPLRHPRQSSSSQLALQRPGTTKKAVTAEAGLVEGAAADSEEQELQLECRCCVRLLKRDE